MAVNLSPIGNDAPFVDSSGNPLNSGNLYTYTAGSSTPQNTYTTSAGNIANANPIVLNANGYPSSGGSVVGIWLTSGISYKFVLKDSSGTTIWTRDNISGINDTTVSIDQWISGPTPTYVSATSFTLSGDQSSTFQVGRRVKTTNTGGTVYSTITASAYTTLTTVTVVNDSGTLDSGLSAVSYALLTATNPSIPAVGSFQGIPSSTLRTYTLPNQSGQMALSVFMRSYLSGCALSNNSGDATNDIDIAAGQCMDSTNTVSIAVSAMTKQLDANWAAGTNHGMRYSGEALTNKTYHIYAVSKADGTQDIYAHTSATVSTVLAALQAESGGASYLYARRIGSIVRAGGTILGFVQDGDYFRLKASVADVSATNPGTLAVSGTLGSVPTGINVFAKFYGSVQDSTPGTPVVVFSDLAANDEAPSTTIASVRAASGINGSGEFEVRTNTSAQIRYRVNSSNANTTVAAQTIGWIDTRGRDA